jgi:accessory gene regulator protein AgrB
MTWAAAASIILGMIVMYIALMFISRNIDGNSSAKNLGAFLAVILGGTVAQFLTSKIGANNLNFAQYVVGLGVGFALYVIVRAVGGGGLLARRLDR